MKKLILLFSFSVVLFFFMSTLCSCSGMLNYRIGANNSQKKCSMDIECGAGKKCSSGVCTGGVHSSIKGNCIQGNFGKKVCSNTGAPCFSGADCFK